MTGLSLFSPTEKPVDGTGNNVQVGDGTSKNVQAGDYIVDIKISRRFRLLFKFVACGALFPMVYILIQCSWDNSGISLYIGCIYVFSSNYTQVVCDTRLQFISDSLEKLWGLSLEFDVATHQEYSYFDVTFPFVVKEDLHNFHLVVIPL